MLLTAYRFLAFIIYALVYPYGRLRAARGRALWQGRLGFIQPSEKRTIWLHAASVGEVKVMSCLVDFLGKAKPDLPLHVTVITEAGYATAEKLFGDKVTLSHLPLDAGPSLRRGFDRINPQMLVIAETEIWFGLIAQAHRREIPVVLVNGRMTEKALGRYRRIQSMLSSLLSRYDRLFLKSETDAERYRVLGANDASITVVGDMKFDAPMPTRSEGRRREIRSRAGIGEHDFLFVAGSTRPCEEEILCDLYRSMRVRHENFRLIIAPRHIERADEVRALIRQSELKVITYGDVSNNKEAVVLVDQFGLLNNLYMAADLAFVGGTLADIGGHNILEPVWMGTPVVYGPYLANVREAAAYIAEHNFGAEVSSKEALFSVVESVYSGKSAFATKTETDLAQSPTAEVGNYILRKLAHV
jgi:3-deoxy-D-manno-octulosonic-acid transferase